MNNYKKGDKVQTPLGIGIVYKEEWFEIFDDEWYIEVMIGEKYGFNRVITFETNYLKPYKTAHDKLLELGYEYIPHSQCHRYKHKEKMDVIDIDLIRSSFCHFHYTSGKKIEPCETGLELSKILTQYLGEQE